MVFPSDSGSDTGQESSDTGVESSDRFSHDFGSLHVLAVNIVVMHDYMHDMS